MMISWLRPGHKCAPLQVAYSQSVTNTYTNTYSASLTVSASVEFSESAIFGTCSAHACCITGKFYCLSVDKSIKGMQCSFFKADYWRFGDGASVQQSLPFLVYLVLPCQY